MTNAFTAGGLAAGQLNLALAQRALTAAQEAALEGRLKVSISIVDRRGDVVCMLRLDDTPWYTVRISQGKAAAAAAFGVASGDLAARAESPALRALLQDGLIAQQGAVPLRIGDHVVGAIGISGAASDDDERVALIGAAAFIGGGAG